MDTPGRTNKTRFLTVIAVIAAAASIFNTALAQDVDFSQVQVISGPTLEYPAHWKLAGEDTIQNRAHSAQAVTDIAGIDFPHFKKRNRVVIESQPAPSAAQIRASIVTPQNYTQADLSALSAVDLQTIKLDLERSFSKVSAAGPVKVHDINEPTIEK